MSSPLCNMDDRSEASGSWLPLQDVCAVCGEVNASNHYGVLTCFGCRSFFRRTLRLQINYVCGLDNLCVVDNETRKCCKKCRYDKCLRVGMSADAARGPRKKVFYEDTNADKDRDSDSSHSSGDSLSHKKSLTFLTSDVLSSESVQRPLSKLIVFHKPDDFQFIVELALSFENDLRKDLRKSLLQYKQLTRNLVTALPSPSLSEPTLRDRETNLRLQALPTIEVLKRQDLFCSISVRDQVSLVRSFLFSAVTLDKVRRSKELDNMLLFFDEVHVVRRENATGNVEFEMIMEELLPAFRYLEPDVVEYAFLKNILFWNADYCDAESKRMVREKQYQFVTGLQQYIANKPLSVCGRFGSLLLMTSTLERISWCLRRGLRDKLRNPDPLVNEIYVMEPCNL